MLDTLNNIGKYIKRTAAVTFLGAGLLLGGQVYSQQNVNINGVVTGVPHNNKINGAKVVAVRVDNNARVDSAYTNANGFYNLDFIWTGQPGQEFLENGLFPNPCSGERNINLNAVSGDNYNLRIFNANGQLVLNENLPLKQGGNLIKLNGGQAGMYFITLTNGSEKQTYRSIQTESTGAPITWTSTSTGTNTPILKSGLEDIITVGDEVRLEFTYPNTNPKESYNAKDTTFIVAPNQTIDQQMQQQEYIFTTTLKPYLDDGTPVTTLAPEWKTTLEFPAPVGTKTYTPNGNNEIVIQEKLFPLNGELGNVTIHHDTTDYFVNGTTNGVLSWIVLREQNQSTTVRNKAQTSSFDLIPEATTTAPLDSLDGLTLNYYMLPKKAETQPGTWFDLITARGWMASSGAGAETSKFIDIPAYAADSLIFILDKLHFTNGTPISTANLDRADAQTDMIIGLYNLQNNDNISPKTARHRSQPGEPVWNKVQNRGYVNSIIFYFDQTSPVNSRSWKSDYTYDGKARLDFCTASYSESATTGQIFSEHYSAITGIIEGSGGLAPYIRGPDGMPTDLAGRMARWVKLLDLGSGNSK